MSLVLAIVWGSSFLWIAIAIDHVAVTVVPLARCAFGALALAPFPRPGAGSSGSMSGPASCCSA